MAIHHRDNSIVLSSRTDTVIVPQLAQYDVAAEYYSTLFHELGHSTGHKDRLTRKGITDLEFFGSEEYSKEVLVAAMLVSQAGLDTEKAFRNSIGYIQSWYKKYMEDNRIFVWAAAKAEAAARYILGETASKG